MNQEQKSRQPTQQAQSQEHLQVLLKETIKQNKILQSKHSKLQGKYVQIFKEMKTLKKDYAVFISFLTKYFNSDLSVQQDKQPFQELQIGQYEMAHLEKLAEQKQLGFKKKIDDLEKQLQKFRTDIDRSVKSNRQEIIEDYEKKVKNMSDDRTKEINALLKEIEHHKKSNKALLEEITQLTKNLELKNNELSRTSKEKLKLEHHLNNIRKKEIAEELSPQKEKEQEKLMSERNEFLSLRQQVESLMAKRDHLKRELKECQLLLATERKKNEILEDEISSLKKSQSQKNEKYELIRQCTLEQLENMILSHHFDSSERNGHGLASNPQQRSQPPQKMEESEQIQKQYLRNVVMRYIKAEISGAMDQSLMLLEVIGNILKLDAESTLALENYKIKRRQWWYIKY